MTRAAFRESLIWRNMENVTVIFSIFANSLYNCAIFQNMTSQIPPRDRALLMKPNQ